MTRSSIELTSAWEAAEARLYPIAMTRPETYARYLEVVAAIADELAPYGTVESLGEAFDRAAEIGSSAVERSGVAADGLDLGLAAGAAFALRYRRVIASKARSEALERIGSARAHGEAWATVSEYGDPVAGPYLRLELHLADGASVQASIGLDAESGAPRYEVEAFAADPRTGDRVSGADPIAPRATFGGRREWEKAIATVRRRVEGGSG